MSIKFVVGSDQTTAGPCGADWEENVSLVVNSDFEALGVDCCGANAGYAGKSTTCLLDAE